MQKSIYFKIEFCIEPDDSGFYAYCPALKGLHVGGSTIEEATQNAIDAATAYLNSLIKRKEPIPLQIVVEDVCTPKASKAVKKQNIAYPTRSFQDIAVAV